MRTLLLFTALLVSSTLSAQFTLSLEQGMAISDDLNYKPIGIALNYEVAEWKGFHFSFGLAFDQVTLETELPLTPENPMCPNASPFCNSIAAEVTSQEFRILLPLSLHRQAGRLSYGLQLRLGMRVHDAIDLTYPILYTGIDGETRTVGTQYGEAVSRTSILLDVGKYEVNTSRFRLQVGTDFRYDLSERLSVGLNYRYEGLLKKDVEITLTDFYRPAGSLDPVYYQGQSRVHYLVAAVGWRW